MKLAIETQAPEEVVVTFGGRTVRASGKGKILAAVAQAVGRKISTISRVDVKATGGSWSHLRSAAAIAQTIAFVRGLRRPRIPSYSGKPKIML